MEVKISASSDRATTPLQAEAQATKLAAILVQRLQLKGAIFLTDNLTLAKALAARAPTDEPGHWQIRSMVADFCSATREMQVQVFHTSRTYNEVAHLQAQKAIHQNPAIPNAFSCHNPDHFGRDCPLKHCVTDLDLQGFVIHDVNCE